MTVSTYSEILAFVTTNNFASRATGLNFMNIFRPLKAIVVPMDLTFRVFSEELLYEEPTLLIDFFHLF